MAEIRDSMSSIVLLGRFNPLIFQPEWLLKNKIIGEQEASAAREGGIEAIHPEVASINLSSKKLIVEPARLTLTVTEEPYVQAKDFVVLCLSILPHTPITAIGINRHLTIRAKDNDQWNRFGDALAPKAPWGDLVSDDKGDRIGGLRAMTMEQSKRLDGLKGYIRVQLEALTNGHPDTHLVVNNHVDLSIPPEFSSAGEAIPFLDENWDKFMDLAQGIATKLAELIDV